MSKKISDKTIDLFISADGKSISTLSYDFDFSFIGTKTKMQRASHVDPDPLNEGRWFVDLSPIGGEILRGKKGKGFKTRDKALKAEEKYVNNRLANGLQI